MYGGAGMANVNQVQVQKFLGGVNYPASKEDLVSYAKQEAADNNVLQTIQALPYHNFDTPAVVSEAIDETE